MSIEGIFAKDINRSINGVVKVQDESDESIRQELEEYVVTRELQRHFATFFESYERAIDVPTDKIGVWISGFFGSGKSHFLKMLSYLLPNREVAGRPALSYFEGKVQDPLVESSMLRSCSVPTQAILFNIDSMAGDWKKGDKAPTALLYGFERMFYEARGFFGKDLKLACLEEHIEEQGKTQEFRDAYERRTGVSWLEDRPSYVYLEDDVIEVLGEVMGMSEATARRWMDAEDDGLLSAHDFAQKVKAYVEGQASSHGGDYRLLFMVDEVGQFITNESDTSLMLSLQTLVEELGATCGGRVWVMVTSQEAIDNLTMVVGNDFSKIQGRFNTRLSLSSSSVDEVIQCRILEKAPTAEVQLKSLYSADATVLKNHFSFEGSRSDLVGYASEREFVSSYPFVGYQFKVLPDVMTEVRKHGVKAKHMSTGERSMLSAFQESAIAVKNSKVGALVPFWRFFDTISKDLEHGILGVIDRAARAAEEGGKGLESFDIELLKLLYLIRYIDYIKSSVENLSILMIDSVDVDKQALKECVKASLDRLVRQNYVARQGDAYNFLTDEEQDIARAIDQTEINSADVVETVRKILFDSIYKERKLRCGANDFPVDRYVDGGIYGPGQNGMTLDVITLLNDLSRASDTEVALKSSDRALVVLSSDYDYYEILENVAKTRKYIRTLNMQNLPPSTLNIIQAKNRQANFDEKEAALQLAEAVTHARVAVWGRMVEIRETSAKAVLDKTLELLAAETFSKADYVGAPSKDDSVVRLTLMGQSDRTLSGIDGGNSRAEADMADFLKLQGRVHATTTMADVQRRYQQRPYGWREVDVANVAAALIAEQRATVTYADQPLRADDPHLPGLLRGKEAEKARIRERVRMSPALVRQASDLLGEFTDGQPVPADEDKLVNAVTEALEATRSECSELVSVNFHGLPGKFPYPGKEVAEALAHEASEVLKSKSDPEALLRAFTQSEDELLDAMEDFEPVREFFKTQKAAFDRAVSFMAAVKSERINLQDEDPSCLENIDSVAEILRDPSPYGRISSLGGFMHPVEEVASRLLSRRRKSLLDKLDGIVDDVQRYADGQGELASVAHRAMGDAAGLRERIKSSAHAAKGASEIDALEFQLNKWSDDSYAKIDAAVDAERERRASQVRTPTVTPEGKFVTTVTESVTKPIAPKLRIKQLSRSMYFPREVLKSEADVNAYVETIRQRLLKELQGNDQIRIR